MKQIYKNLYYDEESGQYVFANDRDTRYVVDQSSYILIYILEVLLRDEAEPVPFLSNESKKEDVKDDADVSDKEL